MKRLFFIIFISITMAFTKTGFNSTQVIITPSSKLLVKGKTNVNSFKCEYDVLKLKNPIPVFFKKFNDKIIFDNTNLVLENVNFDCGGLGINNDFQDLLKTKTHPKIVITVKEITQCTDAHKNFEAFIDLTIAGISKPYVMPIEFQENGSIFIKGNLSLNIRDFNLEPPKKALGLIVVKDVIEIDFQLAIKEAI